MKPVVDWQPIETAPYHTIVLLTGNSGVAAPYDKFICNGYRIPAVHPSASWRDIQDCSLRDMFLDGPTHWAELPNFPDNTIPGE